ncbi:MAG: hypothetical protein DMF61_20705 [Blastocatellia bacterium AA13]|nr:MAG: hypothetical protein DMF61_20705 [Blastocatellia bacterium AA13]
MKRARPSPVISLLFRNHISVTKTGQILRLFAFGLLAGAVLSDSPAQPLASSPAYAGGPIKDGCVDCHQKTTADLVALFSHSTHAKSRVSCAKCHGGDAAAEAKEKAHDSTLVAKPNANEALKMCGFCHVQQSAAFKDSRHFPERANVARLDCIKCHGAHTIGNQARSFNLGLFCAGCHGLEYLPELPERFQQMLVLSDDIRLSMRDLTDDGREPSQEVVNQRREVRRRIAEIVHAADLKGGLEKIPEILKLGDQLKVTIEKAR